MSPLEEVLAERLQWSGYKKNLGSLQKMHADLCPALTPVLCSDAFCLGYSLPSLEDSDVGVFRAYLEDHVLVHGAQGC